MLNDALLIIYDVDFFLTYFFSDLQNSILSLDLGTEPAETQSFFGPSKRMIFAFSHMRLQSISISFRALMLIAEAYPTTLPLMLHILVVNMRVPDRSIKVR